MISLTKEEAQALGELFNYLCNFSTSIGPEDNALVSRLIAAEQGVEVTPQLVSLWDWLSMQIWFSLGELEKAAEAKIRLVKAEVMAA